MIPVYREVIEVATWRLAMGKGLAQSVAESWRKTLSYALHDAENDTPLNRQVRAELEQEGWALYSPGSVDSWDEALAYRTRDEGLADEGSPATPSTPL